jgi:hypothetical protein
MTHQTQRPGWQAPERPTIGRGALAWLLVACGGAAPLDPGPPLDLRTAREIREDNLRAEAAGCPWRLERMEARQTRVHLSLPPHPESLLAWVPGPVDEFGTWTVTTHRRDSHGVEEGVEVYRCGPQGLTLQAVRSAAGESLQGDWRFEPGLPVLPLRAGEGEATGTVHDATGQWPDAPWTLRWQVDGIPPGASPLPGPLQGRRVVSVLQIAWEEPPAVWFTYTEWLLSPEGVLPLLRQQRIRGAGGETLVEERLGEVLRTPGDGMQRVVAPAEIRPLR